jgi:ribosomal protein S18 acetylase RimI-like enzyme
VQTVLDNPVYHALSTGDAHLSFGTKNVKYFDKEVSPFAGFADGYSRGFEELHGLLNKDRKILYASIKEIDIPEGWQQIAYIKGSQFVFETNSNISPPKLKPVPLTYENAVEMVKLATLTKPGPFNMRTIDFGHYYGFFENGKLAAMTGQRLHIPPYSEVSAVCTHPDFLGRGYATALLQHQLLLITEQEQIPFLHVREDNERAIGVYERLGFKLRGPMHFYFFRRIAL